MYRSFSMDLYPQDLESSVESIYDRGTWLGDLGTVAPETDHPDDIPVSQAAAVDFTISSMVQTPDRIQISGTWPETGTDAALVLTDETNTQYWFSIAQPAWQTSETSMDFSIWITPASVPYSHRYRLCLYNLGTLYNTWTFFDNYVDTSDGKNGRGPQKTLYDVDGNSLALTASSAQIVQCGEHFSYQYPNTAGVDIKQYQSGSAGSMVGAEPVQRCQRLHLLSGISKEKQ